jgi:ribosomal protein S13
VNLETIYMIDYTEDVLQARGIECDKRISEMSEEQIKDILEEVRRLREKGKKKNRNGNNTSQTEGTETEGQEQEIVVGSN